MKILTDIAAERGVLAGMCSHGSDAYFDIADIVSEKTFTDDANAIIFKCLKHIIEGDDKAKVDIPSIYSAANALELGYLFKKNEEVKHLQAIMSMPVQLPNVRKFAGIIRKLEIARLLNDQLEGAQNKILEVKGSESISHILGLAENTIFDFTSLLNNTQDEEPTLLVDGITEFVKDLMDNPVEQIGISSGFPVYDKAIGGGFRRASVSMIGARTKAGKAQSLDSTLWTPGGPIKMRDVKIGTVLCHPNGSTTTVIAIHPQGKQDKYKVTFKDGVSTECCLEHLWQATYRKKWKLYTTKMLMDRGLSEAKGRCKFHIPLTKPVQFDGQKTKLAPYMMGLLLGDGSFRSCISITSKDSYIVDYVQSQLIKGYKLRYQDPYGYYLTHGRRGNDPNYYREIIKSYGLWMKGSHDKFIPKEFLYNDVKGRWELLRGLMDTDGTVSRQCVEYATISIQLAKDVAFLVQSLGGLVKIKQRQTSCLGKKFDSYRLRISFPDNKMCFNLPRKKELASTRKKEQLKRGIKSIELVGKDDMQCITVDSPDGLYLTDNFIVTHNSVLAINVGTHVSRVLKIPVLYLDTEMIKPEQQIRLIARLTETPIDDIETGQCGNDPFTRKRVLDTMGKLEQDKLPFSYKNVSGKPFEEILSIMRRWVMKTVGLNDDGTAKDCLIIYDYMKLMSADGISADLKEYQLLGFMMTALHNFAVRYSLPVLSFIQLNRDGITKEGTDAAAGSDRIMWLCSNFSIYKFKSDDEIKDSPNGLADGNRKLVPVIARHGAGLENHDYINMIMTGKYAKIVEGKTAFESGVEKDGGFVTDGPDDEDIPFDG